MNKQPVMVTLPINLAHLMSLSGMLREYAPNLIHETFSAQVIMQADLQGFDLGAKSCDYKSMRSNNINFSIPTACVADVAEILLDTLKDPESGDIAKALNVLILHWTPFVICSMEAQGLGKQQPGFDARNRLTDYPPESLN
tara:strand:+ start:2330 stop:2752 length:423 start_codon:yes stop_codon:yes gene_type:complete